MVDSLDHMLVGYDGDLTFIGIRVEEEAGPLWDKILPFVRGRNLVLELSDWSGEPSVFLQDVLMLASVLQRRETRLWLARVPGSLVRRLGNRTRTLSGTSCLSVDAPFFCPVCETEVQVNLDMKPDLVSRWADGWDSLKKQSCPKCFSAMQFNEVPESFFSFLERMESPLGHGSLRGAIENARSQAKSYEIEALGKNETERKASAPVNMGADAFGAAFSNLPKGVLSDTAAAVLLFALDLALFFALLQGPG